MSVTAAIHNTGYEAIIALVIANATAQLIKFVRDWRRYRRPNFDLLVATGGMPSSHSSTVTALSTSVGLVAGWDSPVFAVAICFAFLTMFDAAGLRHSASLQAQALNVIVRELLAPDHRLNHYKLKELLGHTSREVLAGAVLGVGVSLGLRRLLVLFGG
ncbi:MAG: divergent PAP2 family protein [Candidatus Latescibacteria bacterium]|nr:divergent PAP2 family protein [Candidatus Latescibacterota bacterium]